MAHEIRIIIIRHAHRDTEIHSADNGLSEKGILQSKNLAKYFEQFIQDKSIQCFSSPKIRCQETIAPIAKKFNAEVIVDDRLNELGAFESDSDSVLKIESFINDWKKTKSGTWVVSSHGDWIPKCIHKMFGIWIPLKKAGFVIVELSGNDLSMTWLCQKIPN